MLSPRRRHQLDLDFTPGSMPATSDTVAEERPLLFFLHGFPDTGAVWDELVDHCSAQGYDCARVVSLPYFDPTEGQYPFGLGRWVGTGAEGLTARPLALVA